ncbi:MAG: isocitrate/isopropylmalate dehydrogenase family protein, partial [Candidatus Omnitrophica bacterium]|nr:isocitrate/isopropylmalate dehydrogenase family protein [Candidatus Omnitrophota bacterium]
MAYKVTLIRGDGTGPELADVTKAVLDATGVGFNWDIQNAGLDVMEKEGTPLPDRVLESVRNSKA